MTQEMREAGVFLRALFAPYPSGYAEFRFLRKGGPKVLPGWMALPVNGEALRKTVDVVLGMSADGYDCYVGVLPRARKEGSAESVEMAAWFWADIDYKLCHHTEADRRVADADMIVRSGNGLHAYVRLDAPKVLETKRERERFKAACRKWQLAIHPQADMTADCPRILRVPGTRNYKGPEPRDVRLVKHPGKTQPTDASPRVGCFPPKSRETGNTESTGGAREEMPQDIVDMGRAVDEEISALSSALVDDLPLFRPPLVLPSGRIVSDPNVHLRGILQHSPKWGGEDIALVVSHLKGIGYAC